MALKTINLAVIGSDAAAERQAWACRHLAGVTLAGCWPTAEALAEACPETAARGEPRFDLADLCLPPEAIPAAVQQLPGLARTLLLPAPMSRNRIEADRLLRLLKRQRQKAMLKSWADFSPAAARLREIISSGCLGKILRIQLQQPAGLPGQESGFPPWGDGLAWYDELDLVLCLTEKPAASLEPLSPVTCDKDRLQFAWGAAGAGIITVELSSAAARVIRIEAELGRVSLTWPGPGPGALLTRETAGLRHTFDLPLADPGELAAAWAVRSLRRGEAFRVGQPATGQAVLALLEQLGTPAVV